MNTKQGQDSPNNFKEIFSRIGHLTRVLRDSVANLGLDRAIMDVAEAIPDTRDRLNYVVGKTSQAANRALTSVEIARPLQDSLCEQSNSLKARWDAWFEAPVELSMARELVADTREFLSNTPKITSQTNQQLMEIMMAQDFQDLTGQVLESMMKLIENIERELIQVLVENMPSMLSASPAPQEQTNESLKNGPQINQSAVGVIATQDQVDDLLETLGF
ncbi:protein phosphatase CheZ [Buttiauxella warmboldiae]|uniref:Protein phosphatase CheZ n=1 Tax=Buttiauxella warmboldiae TaxID=82993 RepID=A0A3N5E4H2_9ENTR|nr:protein phosphatase CheZ [Buttiauxella warmboldiae]RPH26533.1 protein phosphatase CheZ [Buttiauxella warmboldiae]